jgi:chromatin assembly factor 1 subunit B
MNTLPSVAAAHSGPVPGMPMWTPPETPIPVPSSTGGMTHSASSSVSGIGFLRPEMESALTRREESDSDVIEDIATRKRSSEAAASEAVPEARPEKRRRVEPTLVSEAEGKSS